MRFVLGLLVWGLMVGMGMAQGQPVRVLWWDGSPDEPPSMLARDREKIADWVGAYGWGDEFATTFRVNRTGGTLARELEQNQ